MKYGKEEILQLLKKYGASDGEIENFLDDLDHPEKAPSDKFDDNDDFENWE